MDTNDYPSLPNLAQTQARLAANNRRVEAIVDGQLAGIERLLSATIAEDWDAVVRATRYLADQDPRDVTKEVVREARFLCQELGRAPLEGNQPKHLANLLAACREARKRL